MSHPAHPLFDASQLLSCFPSGDGLRWRSVGTVVLSGAVDIASATARLDSDWDRQMSRLALEAGDVEALSLARSRTRWPDYRHCVQAVSGWTRAAGLQDVLADSDVALMACRGARYHHDGDQYAYAVFCNLFLSEDKGLDLHFPAAGQRIPLVRGTVVVFDTGQPHAVIDRGSSGFDVDDFRPERDCAQVFLTWEMAVENALVAQALGVAFDVAAPSPVPPNEEGLWRNGAPARVCPASGRWLQGG